MTLAACSPAQRPSTLPETAAPVQPSQSSPTPETPEPPADPIQEQLDSLSLEQKVGQLLIAGIEGYTAGEDAKAAVCDIQAGGIILFKRNVDCAQQLYALNNTLKALNQDYIPLFLCVDEEGGTVSRMPEELTDLPSALTFGQAEDAALCYSLGQTLAEECAAFGFDLDFAPVMDIWSNSDNTVIGSRAFGTDTSAAQWANETARGLSDGGVIPAAKHFPGHGDTLTDSHVGLPVVDKSLEELEELELVPFRQAVESGIPVVMAAHILMTQLDDQRPASLSYAVVTELLREELGFNGVVCTDDLTMAAVSDTYGMGEAAVLAVEAGCDLLLVCHGSDNLTAARDALLHAVQSGRLTEERLDASVYRILSLKAEYSLTNDPVPSPDVDGLNAQIEALLEQLGG